MKSKILDRLPPQLSPEETRELLRRWMDTLEGLKPLQAQLPAGATLLDALAFHRRMNQDDRRPSRVMREEP